MNKEEILKELESLADEKVYKMYQKRGAGDNLFGVKRGELRKIAKRCKTDHNLGLSLWETGNIDARFLAILILDPKEFNEEELYNILETVTFIDVADWFCMYVLKKLDTESLRLLCLKSSIPMVNRVGWFLTAEQIKKCKDSNYLTQLLNVIEERMATENPIVQWTMNTTLANIGIYHESFRERSLQIGEEIGLYRDYPVPKGCTSPFVPIWIKAMVKRDS